METLPHQEGTLLRPGDALMTHSQALFWEGGRLSQGKFDYRSLSDEQVRSLYQSMLASEPSPGTADHVGWMGEMEEIFNRLFPETGKDH